MVGDGGRQRACVPELYLYSLKNYILKIVVSQGEWVIGNTYFYHVYRNAIRVPF